MTVIHDYGRSFLAVMCLAAWSGRAGAGGIVLLMRGKVDIDHRSMIRLLLLLRKKLTSGSSAPTCAYSYTLFAR